MAKALVLAETADAQRVLAAGARTIADEVVLVTVGTAETGVADKAYQVEVPADAPFDNAYDAIQGVFDTVAPDVVLAEPTAHVKTIAGKLAAKGTISATAQGERDAVLAAAATVPGLTDLRVTAEKGGEVSFTAVSESGADLRGALSLALAKAGCPVLNLRAESMSLEDVFLQLTEAPEETETTETETNEQEAE